MECTVITDVWQYAVFIPMSMGNGQLTHLYLITAVANYHVGKMQPNVGCACSLHTESSDSLLLLPTKQQYHLKELHLLLSNCHHTLDQRVSSLSV